MRARALVGLVLVAASAGAQDVDLTPRPPRDSALARAQEMATTGQHVAARRLVDSLLAGAQGERYAEALFWRGAFAATPADAERSFRQLLIEAPLSDRAEEAMLQLARLELSRGNRRAATDHLYRYMLSYGPGAARPTRPRIGVWLARLLFEQGDQPAKACDAVRMAREATAEEGIELRNQLEQYTVHCAHVQAAAPAPDTSRPAADTGTIRAPADSGRRPARQRPAPAPSAAQGQSVFSVQVAAYDSREAATRLAELLVSRGIDARVDGTQRPYRVRVGRYATRAEAARMQQALRGQGHNGFVTPVRP